MSSDNRSFYKITNTMIYDRLVRIEHKLDYTNGKVKLNRWISTTALSIILAIITGISIKYLGSIL